MTKYDLIRMVAKQCHLSQSQTKDVINALFEGIVQATTQQRTLTIRGFGTFTVKTYHSRTIVDIHTHNPVHVPQQAHIKFKAAANFQERIRQQIQQEDEYK